MNDWPLIASRLVLLLAVFLGIGFGLIPVLEWLEQRAKRRNPLPRCYACTTLWAPFFTVPTNEPPFSIGIACRAPQWSDAVRNRCQRRAARRSIRKP